MLEKIIQYLDDVNGGFKGAPKFPQFYIFANIAIFTRISKNKKFYKTCRITVNENFIQRHL